MHEELSDRESGTGMIYKEDDFWDKEFIIWEETGNLLKNDRYLKFFQKIGKTILHKNTEHL